MVFFIEECLVIDCDIELTRSSFGSIPFIEKGANSASRKQLNQLNIMRTKNVTDCVAAEQTK